MNILIIDDHELFSEGLKLLLLGMDEDLTISIANSCNTAIEYFSEQSIELILLDYHLPDSIGTESINRIKKIFPSTVIIVISSEDSQVIIHETIDAGAAGFIPKSSSRNIMIAAFQLVLAGGIYLPTNAYNHSANYRDRCTIELTDRQKQTLALAIRGVPNKIIAHQLDIAEGTVKAHLSAAFQILGVKNRTEAVLVSAKYKL